MSKIPTDLVRHALNGPTMGARWSALFHASATVDPAPVRAALQAAVEEVDAQMSTWKPESDLMRLNRAAVGKWMAVPNGLMEVLARAAEIGRLSDGAFDIGMGDVIAAWGFGAEEADTEAMRAAFDKARTPAHEVLELDANTLRVRKRAGIALDLSGIAKGYGVDRMMDVMERFGIGNVLVGIDGEMRAHGRRPDDRPWTIAVEHPDYDARAPLSILELTDCAVATSGDYRRWVDIGERRLSHTMDPERRGPLTASPASVTVLAETCMEADAWATALMVKGGLEGTTAARRLNLNAVFVERERERFRQTRVGPLFRPETGLAGDVFECRGRP